MKYKRLEVRDPNLKFFFLFLMNKSQVFAEAFLNFVGYDFSAEDAYRQLSYIKGKQLQS
jgi:hypothetical protein